MNAVDRFHLRSYVCALGHELRITGRCLSDDLGESAVVPFDEMMTRHGIVKAFQRERTNQTVGIDTLRPSGRDKSLTVLRHTNDWRGVTWFEEDTGVVWLCACAPHRSGQADDAFPRFQSLREDGRIWPRSEDYEAFAVDYGKRFADFVQTDAPQLLTMARANPDVEHVLLIGPQPVAIVVHIVETLEETFVAFSGVKLIPEEFLALLAALYPDRVFDEWQHAPRLPTRELDRARSEFCLSIVHG